MTKQTRREILISSAALAATAAATAQIARSQSRERPLAELQNELRNLIPASMRQHNVPGLSLALARDRQIVWAEAFGLADKEANVRLTPDTVFEAASLTKPAYSYAVLRLADQGRIDLQRPLLDY